MEVELRAFSTENSQLPKVQARTQKRWNPGVMKHTKVVQAKLDKANQEHTGHTTLLRLECPLTASRTELPISVRKR